MLFDNENNKDEIKELIKKINHYSSIKDTKKEIENLLKLSNIYFNNKELDKAKLNLEKILKIENNISKINYYLSLIEIEKGNINEAKKYLKKELKINPNNKESKELLNSLNVYNNFPYLTISIIIIIILNYFFLNQNNNLNSIDFLLKYSSNYFNLNILSIFYSIFIHINLIHLISNSIILLIFGLILEKEIGSFKFGILLFGGSIIGNLIEIFLRNQEFVIGISGGIFTILGYLTATRPLFNIRIFGIIKTNLIILFSLFFIIDFFLLSYNSAKISHLFGFYIGLLIGSLIKHENHKNFYSWILISSGFYILVNSSYLLFQIIKDYNTYLNFELIISIILIIIGIIIIIIPYNLIKKINFNNQNEN
jgi:membrane associated rhomboid family serine protease